jgi:hypothetical protein
MTKLDYNAMGKEALRQEMRGRELSYSRMNNDQMRDALRANDADLGDMLTGEDEFEMSTEELAAQQDRQELQERRGVELGDTDKQQIAAEVEARKPAAPRTRKGVTIEKDREERNGVKRPSKGGVCREVWDFLDGMVTLKLAPTAKDVRENAGQKKWNPNNAMIEFYQWRKFNGISGRAK